MHLIIDCTTTQNQLKNHGIGQYTKNIVKGILEKGDIDVTLLLFKGESTLDPYLKKRKVNVERIGGLRLSDYKNVITYVTRILPVIRRIKRDDSVYFCPYFWIGIPSRHVPTVLAIHDFVLPKFNIYSEKGYIQNGIKRILYWLELRKAKDCKAILTCSKHTAKDFKKYFPKYPSKNVHTIYLDGVLEESKDIKGWDIVLPKDYKEKGYFIYMGGTVAKSKNSDGVVKGYKEFLTKFNNVQEAPYLVIAGKNFTNDSDLNVVRFKDRIKCLGLKSKVIFTGYYKDIHAKPLLSNSISFIHLSLYEGFGISVIEAMRAKAPVIAHKGSCYPEVIGDGGLLVDGRNSKEVGTAMYTMYTDTKLRDSYIQKGIKRSNMYSWETTVSDTLSVFESVL